ncbi:MAG: MoaD/ThiS family protein [Chloroflexi bacterium]|nr:MoaD/ThiS family protein [Chloroflexota bacterium]
MRVLIGSPGCEISTGAFLSDLVAVYEEKLSDDPVIKSLKEKDGKSYLVFIVNGVVMQPNMFDQTRLNAGDDVRIVHPVFGG